MISDDPTPEVPGYLTALLRLLLTRSPASLAIFDREMRYVVYTREWTECLPVGAGTLQGRTHREVMPGLLASWIDGHQRALRGESVSSEAESYEGKDGTKRWISWTIHPWIDERNEVAGSLISVQEMTARVSIESRLRLEMEAAAATRQAKTRLLAGACYEVRAAMNSIIGMSHLCLRSAQASNEVRHLRTVIEEANALTSSFDDLLDVAKMESGSLTLEQGTFSLGELLNDLASEIGVKAEKKGIEFVYKLARDHSLELVGDAVRLRQVLTRLCETAIRLTERGEIELEVGTSHRGADTVTLDFRIRDSSPDLTSGQREMLLAPYSPGDPTDSGDLARARLGLSVCRGLIGLMKGKLGIESAAQGGNVLVFSAVLGISVQKEVPSNTPHHALLGARVLVVDDHALARKTMVRLLRSFDFEVAEAECGADAVEKCVGAVIAGRPYHFVFMDYLMPRLDGLKAAGQLKQRIPSEHQPKIILMTGYPMKDQMRGVTDSPLDGFVPKPFTPSLIFYAMLDAATAWRAAAADGQAGPHGSTRSRLRGARVLLVEDDLINQEIVQEILGDVGVEVDLANNGKEGLTCLERKTYAAVLMDIQMPVMDGYEATCRIRSEARYADLPIIALTASSMTLDRHASLEVGMNAHVAKPIDPEELFTVLGELIEVPEGLGLPVEGAVVAEAEEPARMGVEDLHAALYEPEDDTLDIAKGIALMAGKEDLYYKVLGKFATNQCACDREIRAALKMSDEQGARRLVHTLKGLAGSIGAAILQDRAAQFEDAMVARKPECYELHLRHLSFELQRILREISRRLSARERAATGAAPLPVPGGFN